jgi:hypothetical protein
MEVALPTEQILWIDLMNASYSVSANKTIALIAIMICYRSGVEMQLQLSVCSHQSLPLNANAININTIRIIPLPSIPFQESIA